MFVLHCKESFEAAHYLSNYVGKCHDLHGHSFHVDITVTAEQLQRDGTCEGMVVDYTELKAIVKNLDHTCLNKDIKYFRTHSPTSEEIAEYIGDTICDNIRDKVHNGRISVSVRETDDQYCEYIRGI